MQKIVVGMFSDSADARRAVYDLQEDKFPSDTISVVMREKYDSAFGSRGGLLSLAVGNQASTTPMDHGAIKVAGLYPATAEGSPGIGPLIAAGPLAAGLGGAALGVAAGGITGALSDVGIPNELATTLIDRVRSGKETMLTIRVDLKDTERVENTLVENGAAVVYRGTQRADKYKDGRRSGEASEYGL